MFRALIGVPALVLVASVATAAPFWVTYEGTDFPENVGWDRNSGSASPLWESQAVRSLSDGSFRLDTLDDVFTFDYYTQGVENDLLSLCPDGVLMIEWRMRLLAAETADQAITFETPVGGVFVRHWLDQIIVRTGSLEEPVYDHVSVALTEYHIFTITIADLENFELFVDDVNVMSGSLDTGLGAPQSSMSFGDNVSAGGSGGSVAQWDYVRFGVVPEPATGVLWLACLSIVVGRRY